MKRLLMVCSLMLFVMATMAQAKPLPKKPLPIKKEQTDTSKTSTQKGATLSPVILNNQTIQKFDVQKVQVNPPPVINKNTPNSDKSKEANKAAEELKNKPQEATAMELKPVLKNVTAFVPKTIKLKITTTDIQCIKKSNKHPKEKYEIHQFISYKTLGNAKVPEFFYIDGKGKLDPVSNNEGSYFIVKSRPVHGVSVGSFQRDYSNLNTSFVYTISETEMSDPNAKMLISTEVKEMSGSSLLNFDFENIFTEVAIKDVLAVLIGKRPLYANKPYLDSDIAKGIKFDDFGGFKLYLTRVDYKDKVILEGPIRRRTTSGKEKAAVWMRFELVE